jgi:hypothetical protein
VDHFYQNLVSWTWSLFGPNVRHLKLNGDPFHAETICCNVFPQIMVALYDVACAFSVLITTANCYSTFAVKVDGVAFMDDSEIPSNLHSSIHRWLAAMIAIHPFAVLCLSRRQSHMIRKVGVMVSQCFDLNLGHHSKMSQRIHRKDAFL